MNMNKSQPSHMGSPHMGSPHMGSSHMGSSHMGSSGSGGMGYGGGLSSLGSSSLGGGSGIGALLGGQAQLIQLLNNKGGDPMNSSVFVSNVSSNIFK